MQFILVKSLNSLNLLISFFNDVTFGLIESLNLLNLFSYLIEKVLHENSRTAISFHSLKLLKLLNCLYCLYFSISLIKNLPTQNPNFGFATGPDYRPFQANN